MGGSDSRCCVDSDEKTLQEYAVGYKQGSQLQSSFHSAGTGCKIVRMDPRSPSSRVDRTPIQVSGTPSGQPKPLMRVQPMIEREPIENSTEKELILHTRKVTDEAVLLDPRSPAAPGSRTPILVKSKHYDVMQDPRSPTLGIVRTPLLESSTSTASTQSYCEDVKLNEGNGSCDFAICQTPQKHVYAMTNSTEASAEAFQGVFDPRSPSDGIDRTPLGEQQDNDDTVFLSDGVQDRTDNKFQVIYNINDPRSPSERIERTPVGKIEDREVTTSAKYADDLCSSNAEMPRTPLGAVFSGRRELRRAVLLSNALMASPLTMKIAHSSVNAPDVELNQAESTANQNFLDIPSRKLGNFNESRSSSVIAVMGSDVDSLSNLEESVDENLDSPILNVVDVSQDKEIGQGQIYEHMYGKQLATSNRDISHHMGEGPCDARLKPSSLSHRSRTLASECGSSVDANEKYVTAKFSVLSTDDEYQTSQEVNDPVIPLKLEASDSYNVATPSFDDSTSANINFVTTYEILDDEKDVRTMSELSVTKSGPNKDEFQNANTSTNLPNTDLSEGDTDGLSGEKGAVYPDAGASNLYKEERVGEEINDSVDNSKWVVISGATSDCAEENLANASNGLGRDGGDHNYSAPDEKISESASSELSASNEGSKLVLEENSRSDNESLKCKNTLTTSNRKKPKRRLRTPKAVTRKHRHISASSNTISSCDFDLETAKPKSKSNSQLFHIGTTFESKKNAHISSEALDGNPAAASRSPLATLTNDFGKSSNGLTRKNRGAHSATKLPRYRATPKAAGRSLSGSFEGQSAKRKTVSNKEN